FDRISRVSLTSLSYSDSTLFFLDDAATPEIYPLSLHDALPILKANPDVQPQAIADVFQKHGIDSSRCQKVGAMVMPQLRKQGLKPEDARIVMRQVRAAYPLVP